MTEALPDRKTYGSLTIISEAEPSGYHRRVLCRCVCGGSRIVRVTSLVCSRITACAKCGMAAGREKRARNYPEESKKLTEAFHTYKSNARRKGYAFELTREQVKILLDNPCHYCGETPSQGIDRKDNFIGYTPQNSLSCCRVCNYAKKDAPYNDFLSWIGRIHNNAKDKGILQ